MKNSQAGGNWKYRIALLLNNGLSHFKIFSSTMIYQVDILFYKISFLFLSLLSYICFFVFLMVIIIINVSLCYQYYMFLYAHIFSKVNIDYTSDYYNVWHSQDHSYFSSILTKFVPKSIKILKITMYMYHLTFLLLMSPPPCEFFFFQNIRLVCF